MNNQRKILITVQNVFLLLVLLAITLPAQSQEKALKMLFIGNSYTFYDAQGYYNNVPEILKQLTASSAEQFSIEYVLNTSGGYTLERHWKEGKVTEKIREGGWDYVVLQEQSMRPITDTTMLYNYARKFDYEIKLSGAKTVFYLTWARKSTPERQVDYNNVFKNLGTDLNAVVAPSGQAWNKWSLDNLDVDLYSGDGSHPNMTGSYLTACVFYSVLFNKNPEGLTGSISFDGKDNLILRSNLSSKLQKMAWDIVSNRR